jgi:hypothetical protein
VVGASTAQAKALTAGGAWRDQLRIPKGNGARSGRWTFTPWKHIADIESLLGTLPDGLLKKQTLDQLGAAKQALSVVDENNFDPSDPALKAGVEKAAARLGFIKDYLLKQGKADQAVEVDTAQRKVQAFADTDWTLFNPKTDTKGDLTGEQKTDVGWGGHGAAPEKSQVALKSKLEGLIPPPPPAKYDAYLMDVRAFCADQFVNDPNSDLILKRGKYTPISDTTNYEKDGRDWDHLGENGECHWNVAKLQENKEIDSTVIGYAFSDDLGWFQHTWGLKNGKIVETTSGNQNAKGYFGAALTKKEADSFAAWCKANPPGAGKVRHA